MDATVLQTFLVGERCVLLLSIVLFFLLFGFRVWRSFKSGDLTPKNLADAVIEHSWHSARAITLALAIGTLVNLAVILFGALQNAISGWLRRAHTNSPSSSRR
jgi:hypothetical protein